MYMRDLASSPLQGPIDGRILMRTDGRMSCVNRHAPDRFVDSLPLVVRGRQAPSVSKRSSKIERLRSPKAEQGWAAEELRNQFLERERAALPIVINCQQNCSNSLDLLHLGGAVALRCRTLTTDLLTISPIPASRSDCDVLRRARLPNARCGHGRRRAQDRSRRRCPRLRGLVWPNREPGRPSPAPPP